MLRQLRGMADGRRIAAENKGRALLVPAPGEQHTFGLRVVEEFLLRDGWEVRSNLRASHEEIVQLAAEEDYDFVGFSISGERLLPALLSVIERVRKVSRNRGLRIMVGGVAFIGHPELVKQVDADAAIFDAQQAVAMANEWYMPAQVN
jgi:methanogenic corrinoid protein MtbC1